MPVIAELARIHASIEQAALTELSKLQPPHSLAGAWRRLLAYRRLLAGQLLDMAQSAQRSDSNGIQSFVVASERVKHQLLATERAGFDDCARVE